MNFLVTGGVGFIGSHIVETLLKKGLSPQIANSKETKGTDPDIKGTVKRER